MTLFYNRSIKLVENKLFKLKKKPVQTSTSPVSDVNKIYVPLLLRCIFLKQIKNECNITIKSRIKAQNLQLYVNKYTHQILSNRHKNRGHRFIIIKFNDWDLPDFCQVLEKRVNMCVVVGLLCITSRERYACNLQNIQFIKNFSLFPIQTKTYQSKQQSNKQTKIENWLKLYCFAIILNN